MEETRQLERMASFAVDMFADFDARELYEGCSFLPIWHFRRGDWFGSGDFPEALKTKAAAKGVCANQVRREGVDCAGYVAERRDGRVFLYRVGDWQDGLFVPDRDCWKNPLVSVRLDGQDDWEVKLAPNRRSRLSPLAASRAHRSLAATAGAV